MLKIFFANDKYLAEAMNGHNNNLNLIRIIAASLVLYSHSFTIVTGDLNQEPLRVGFGVTLGSIAVDVFLVISGLLVTTSLRRGKNAISFVKARFLRIWPGLIVSFIITVYLIGAIVSKTDLNSYFFSSSPLVYFYKGLYLSQASSFIAGVFTGNPAGPGFNASLWTLAVEVRMYFYLLIAWLISRLAGKHKENALFCAVSLIFFHYTVRHFGEFRGSVENSGARLPFMFFCGSMLTFFSGKIRLNEAVSTVFLLLLFIGMWQRGTAFYIIYSLCLPILVIYISYYINGKIRRYNAFGDYSFGMYIYAWPIQQALMVFYPNMGIVQNQIGAFSLTLLLAVLSWRLVEKPALSLKAVGWYRSVDRV